MMKIKLEIKESSIPNSLESLLGCYFQRVGTDKLYRVSHISITRKTVTIVRARSGTLVSHAYNSTDLIEQLRIGNLKFLGYKI